MSLLQKLRGTTERTRATESPLFNLRKEIKAEVERVLSSWKIEIMKMAASMIDSTAFMQEAVKRVTRNFHQPKDGKDADEKVIVGRVLKLIPQYATLEETSDMVRAEISKLNKIPTEQDIQNIANGIIESGDAIVQKINAAEEKIDPKQIRGLEDMFKQAPRKGGGGGGMGEWVHEKFDTDSSTTSVTLRSRIAASGNAILVRYQGQMLAHGVQYTVAGKTISFTFTLEDSTFVEVTYIRT